MRQELQQHFLMEIRVRRLKLATSEEFKRIKQYVVGMFMSLEKGGMDIIGEAIKKTGTFKKQIDEYFSLMRIWFRVYTCL